MGWDKAAPVRGLSHRSLRFVSPRRCPIMRLRMILLHPWLMSVALAVTLALVTLRLRRGTDGVMTALVGAGLVFLSIALADPIWNRPGKMERGRSSSHDPPRFLGPPRSRDVHGSGSFWAVSPVKAASPGGRLRRTHAREKLSWERG